MNTLLSKLRKDPIGLLKRLIYKKFLAPWRYKSKDGYDAGRYWGDRLNQYGSSLKGPGDEGLSEEENRVQYQLAASKFLQFCQTEGVELSGASVLEIGCGTGFYTELVHSKGIRSYQGVDITDVLFERFRERFPQASFQQADVTTQSLSGQFDIVLMIDVIEHIVTPERFRFAMRNVAGVLKENGVFLLAPLMQDSRKHLFYVKFWTRSDLVEALPEFSISEPMPFREGDLVAVRKRVSSPS